MVEESPSQQRPDPGLPVAGGTALPETMGFLVSGDWDTVWQGARQGNGKGSQNLLEGAETGGVHAAGWCGRRCVQGRKPQVREAEPGVPLGVNTVQRKLQQGFPESGGPGWEGGEEGEETRSK